MAEYAPTQPPPQPGPTPWAAPGPTTSTGQVTGVPTHPGHATSSQAASRQVAEHLRLLGILSYVYGGLQGIGVLFGLFYAAMGLLFVFMPQSQGMSQQASQQNQPPPELMGWIFFGVGLFIIVIAGVLMALTLVSARDLMRHRRRVFCLVVAGTHCLNIPLGLILGIFTFVVLNKPKAKALFEANAK